MTVVLAHSPAEASAGATLTAALEQAAFRSQPLVAVNVTTGDAPLDPRIADDEEVAALERAAAGAGVELVLERPVGDVAEAVLDAAERHAASLVVLGVRRRSAVGKLLLGSVSQRVILEADCPVLGVKAP